MSASVTPDHITAMTYDSIAGMLYTDIHFAYDTIKLYSAF